MRSLLKTFFVETLLALAAILAPAGVSSALAAQDNQPRAPRDARVKVDREDLAAPLRNRGEVRVIVELRPQRLFAPNADTTQDIEKSQDVGERQNNLLARLAGQQVRNVKFFRYHHFAAMTVDGAALDRLLVDPDVISIAEDKPVYPVLNNTPAITRADKAWAVGARGTGQAVAILDSGVDTAHPFFAGKIIAEACFSTAAGDENTSYCPNPDPPNAQFPGTHQIGPGAGIHCPDANLTCWHGTHVAGIAAGRTGVLSPTAGGMAPDARIIPIQVFQRECPQGKCAILAYESDLISALEYVYSLRGIYSIAAANLSIGGGLYTAPCDDDSPGLAAVIQSLRGVGIATVIASGNNSNASAISFPACISSSISVGSTTKSNTISSFSNSSNALHLLAPGSAIVSSLPGGGFGGANGTSMATPHVTGAWATLKSAKPTATVAEVLAALQSGGLPITDTRNGITRSLIQIGYDANTPGALGTLLGHGNAPPSISITSPNNGATFTAPASIPITVSANDGDGGVSKVEYFSGTTKIFESTAAPYSFTWTSVPVGNYALTAKATDVVGGTTVSSPINVSVTGNPTTPIDSVWVEDAIPAGGTAGGNETWNWVSSTPAPFSGALAHRSNIVAGMHQHLFTNATATLNVGAGDTLFAYVYLDPASPPSQVMLQWNDGTWEHRAYWGANLIGWGTQGTASLRNMGPLPPSGQWVRLEVPASQVGLENRVIRGMAFTLFNGRATWDRAGKSSAGGPPSFTLSGTVTTSGSPLSGVSFAGSNGATCNASNAAGQYSCTVSQGYTGAITPTLNGYTFAPSSRSYSNVITHQSTQNYAATQNLDTVWVEDAIPAGGTPGGTEAWSWVNSSPAPFSGALAHRTSIVPGMHQHHFNNATATLNVGAGDTLFAYVYLDPASPPSQVMLQWNDGTWEHRAYWGADLIEWGVNGTVSRRFMGSLPPLGQWVRLEVLASQVGLENRAVRGMAFTLFNGRATWDRAGKR